MSKKPDGSPARTERVTFTKPAAERIAKVVRTVEGGNRDCGPLTFGARFASSSRGSLPIRLAQTSGLWRNEPPLNVKAVQLFRQQTREELDRDPQPWEWVPETDEFGDPVFAVTINWFSHVPTGQGDQLKWCAVVPISDLAGEYDTGQVTSNDGVEEPIMRPYSKLWLLIAVEC